MESEQDLEKKSTGKGYTYAPSMQMNLQCTPFYRLTVYH